MAEMKKATYSLRLAGLIQEFLDKDDWHYTFDEKDGVFKFGYRAHGPLRDFDYLVFVHRSSYQVYAVSSVSADPDEHEIMGRLSEFFHRANYGVMNGNFELDFEEGEIAYKCNVNCNGMEPSECVLRDSIYWPAGMFKRYGKGIVAVLFGGADPKDAVEACEEVNKERDRELLQKMLELFQQTMAQADAEASATELEEAEDDEEEVDDEDDPSSGALSLDDLWNDDDEGGEDDE